MRVIHTTPDILEIASGVAQAVPPLCQAIQSADVDVELHVYTGEKTAATNYELHTHASWRFPPRVNISPSMRRALDDRMKLADIIHTHSSWMMANIYPGWTAKKHNKPFVFTPHGTFSDYAMKQSRWKKQLIWKLWQKRVFLDAACINVTSEEECSAVRRLGSRSPIALIPNGIALPNLSHIQQTQTQTASKMRRLIFLGRLHPIKGIDHLLKAWAVLENRFTDWELHITGTDHRGHEGEMKQLMSQLNLQRVTFTGPAYNAEKTNTFCDSDLFVLPTHSENFGLAIAEALTHRLPVITTKGAPWEGLAANDCGWWIDIGVDPLVDVLKVALATSPEILATKGANGRNWMARDFSWEVTAKKMIQTYHWLLTGADQPVWIAE